MTKEEAAKLLHQKSRLQWLQRRLPLTDLIPVCLSDHTDEHIYGLHCALVPFSERENVLGTLSWDLGHDDGMPGASMSSENGKEIVEYHRFGWRKGIEPLLIDRGFHGIRPDYVEISEEFRLFHNLYHDRKTDQYIKIDNAGNEEVIIAVSEDQVEIRLKEILQFLAIKEMYLSIQFDFREMVSFTLDQLGLKEGGDETRDDLMCWGLHYSDMGHRREGAFSRLWGKRLVKPVPKENSGFWGFAKEEPEKYLDFIVAVDEDGNDILHTSDPDHLADNFGGKCDSPHYLTPVHFRKQVLDKYYQQPQKFSVEDSYLRCGSLWGFQMDNHHGDQVCAWLGDLGRDLPYEEQLHWKAHNVSPKGTVSDTYFRRQLLNQWTTSNRPEDQFKRSYANLSKVSQEKLGWQILKPLREGDLHHLSALRVPANNEQREFDELTLSLTKLLIDSINEKELGKLIPADQKKELKGTIMLLERVLILMNAEDYKRHIGFLRNLQELRSSSAAHRKGSSYKKLATKLGLDGQPLPAAFSRLLSEGAEVLDYLCVFTEHLPQMQVAGASLGTTNK
jgi:hypothetical protein